MVSDQSCVDTVEYNIGTFPSKQFHELLKVNAKTSDLIYALQIGLASRPHRTNIYISDLIQSLKGNNQAGL